MSKATAVGKLLTSKKLNTFGIALGTFSAVSEYKQSRLEGRGVVSSGISAAGNALIYEAFGMKMFGMQLAAGIPNAAMNAYLKANATARSMDRTSRNIAFDNATFADSQQAYTMRQAGMQMAQTSKYNLQQTLLGNEASSMHRI